MEDLHECSDLPYFEGEWEGVFRAGKYALNMCLFTTETWPITMMPGLYKFVMEFFDDQDVQISITNLIVLIEAYFPIG